MNHKHYNYEGKYFSLKFRDNKKKKINIKLIIFIHYLGPICMYFVYYCIIASLLNTMLLWKGTSWGAIFKC